MKAKHVRAIMAMAGALVLPACFGAERSLVAPGEGILPVDHAITLCPEGEDSCFTMQARGDGYVTPPDMRPGDRGTARFAALMAVDGVQVYILEMRPDGEREVLHLLARRAAGTSRAPATLDVAAPDCSDLAEEAREAFEAAGGEISSGFVSTCRSPDIESLRQALRATYGEQLGGDDWWIEQPN